MKILVIHFKRQSPAWFVFGIALKLLSRLFDSLFTNSFKQLPLLLPQLFTSPYSVSLSQVGWFPRGQQVLAHNVAQSLRCWASVLSVGGTGGPASGAWGHHMQHQHIARLAAQPGQPPAWLRSYVPGLLVDKEIEKEVDKARPWRNWWTLKLFLTHRVQRPKQLLPCLPDLPSSIFYANGFMEINILCARYATPVY